jgi:uncharacterized protein
MTCLLSNHISRRVSCVAVGFSLILLTNAEKARAIDPEILQMQTAAQRGSIEEQIRLGAAYFVGRGVEQSSKLAAYWYERAANAGDPRAQKQIGFFYQAGIGVQRDPERAVKWFQRAAVGGLIDAKVNLGVAYLTGTGVPKDPAFATQLFREALAKGDGRAAFALGEMCYFGLGVAKDPSAAQHWYEQGAKRHEPLSEFRMGTMLMRSNSTPQELKKADQLLRASVAAGYVPALHVLGLLMLAHPELARTSSEAAQFFTEAAAAGIWQSSMALGILARDGTQMPADPAAAYFHFRVATLEGGDQAAELLARDVSLLSARLEPTQKAAKEAEAEAWSAKHRLALQFIYRNGDLVPDFPAFALTLPREDSHAGLLLATPSN